MNEFSNTIKKEEVEPENRDEQGRFVPGTSGNPLGRPSETPEQRVVKRVLKGILEDYKNRLAEALPELSYILIEKAKSGDLGAIKEIHDRVMGRPHQTTESETTHKGEISIRDLFDRSKEAENE